MKYATALLLLVLVSCASGPRWAKRIDPQPQDKHIKAIRQLTADGVFAEAYYSPDGKKLILQRADLGQGNDQIYSMDLDTGALTRLSNGEGKCT